MLKSAPCAANFGLNVFDLRLCSRDQLNVAIADVVDVLGECLKLGQSLEVSSDEETHLSSGATRA